MITIEALDNLSKDRLEDAKILYKEGRIDWAVYTCGYAVELALKKRISQHLKWKGYPSTDKEFGKLKCLKMHHLDTLLTLSGVEDEIKGGEGFTEWSIITSSWDPEMRYSSEKQSKEGAKLLLEMVEKLLAKL